MHVYTYTHAHTYSAEELGYPSWGTQTITFKRTHNYWVLGIHCWVRGASGQFHLGEIHLPVPLASQPVPHIPLSLPLFCVPCIVTRGFLLLFPSLSQNEGMCLETVAEGAILFLKKKLLKKKMCLRGCQSGVSLI